MRPNWPVGSALVSRESYKAESVIKFRFLTDLTWRLESKTSEVSIFSL